MLCIAHRGGQGPENSLAAIRHSLALGVSAIEIDVWQLHGELWVTHDRRLGRDLAGEGALENLSPQALSALRRSNGEPLLTLKTVLEEVGERALLNIELKGPDCVPALSQLLTAHCQDWQQGMEHYVVSSFDHQQLLQLSATLPHVRRGALIYGVPSNYAACAKALGAYSLNASLDFLPAELVADARRRGLKVWVYTANHEDDWEHLMEMGVDGVFTDEPTQLLNSGLGR